MVAAAQVREVALFFLFALMDEKVAVEAAQKTVAQLKAKPADAVTPTLMIRVLHQAYDHYRRRVPRNRPSAVPVAVWSFDSPVTIDAWTRFQKEATEAELVAVILSHILVYNDVVIADGLGISLGTARYRIGKGIRHLGLIVRQTAVEKRSEQ